MITNASSPEDKVRLFSSLFRGRADIYALRYASSKTGKTGYSPVCHNRWQAGVCDMKNVRCAVCPHRRFASVSDDVFRQHLLGADPSGRPFSAAVYPLGLDERTRFALVQFSGGNWREDTAAVREASRSMRVPCAVERAREGDSARVWFFFAEPVDGRIARDVATAVLFAAFRRRPELGVEIFDSILPAQDTLPRGQLGALAPLPLDHAERKAGRTVFVDPAFVPYRDQWAFLGQVRRIGARQAESIVRDALASHSTLIPPDLENPDSFAFVTEAAATSAALPPEASSVTVRLDNRVRIERRLLTPPQVAKLIGLATFVNPEFHDAQRMRLPARSLRRVISCATLEPDEVRLPRGCCDAAMSLLSEWGLSCKIDDERCAGKPLDVEFHGELRPEQKHAADDILAHDGGVLAAGTAFGKTVLAAFIIAARKTNTLILVNRRQLQAQWIARLATFLDIPEKSIGRIGGGASRPKGGIDVALVQSLVRKGKVRDIARDYGQVIVDECHAIPAPTFEALTDSMRAKYFLGLSATVMRRDGHHPQIVMQCGPIRHRADGRRTTDLEPFAHVVLVRPTAFAPSNATTDDDGRLLLPKLVDEIVADEVRNKMIATEVLDALAEGRSPVVLSERRVHLEVFESMLRDKVANIVMLRGGMGKRELKKVREKLDSIPDGEPRVLLATGPYLGEGFDDARLDTLFLALPVSWRGRITQYVGRLHRRHVGKREVRVYDYVDLNAPVCNRMFDRRSAGYEALGYKIVLPLSSTPGWPREVLLPLEREWQETYAASVKRLCIDGVDAALASLFVMASTTVAEDDEGVQRACSAAEAFLFQRLETLPETRGRFSLNDKLPIAFGKSAFLEPDLLCGELRIAIEIDGLQHLGSAEAYRRDRRKDMLLQENGYFVMRFLYDDVLSNLDYVLSAILWEVRRRQPVL
jgi:superfamily II DNA or RNA helicase